MRQVIIGHALGRIVAQHGRSLLAGERGEPFLSFSRVLCGPMAHGQMAVPKFVHVFCTTVHVPNKMECAHWLRVPLATLLISCPP